MIKITHTTAKELLLQMYKTGKSADELIKGHEEEYREFSYEETEEVIDKVVKANPGAVAQYRR